MAGLAGLCLPVWIYLAFNWGTANAHGWGAAMSTDTAFALGALALAGKGLPDRVRTFLLSVCIVDDLLSLVVIGVAYSGSIKAMPLIVGFALLAVVGVLRMRGIRNGIAYLAVGLAAWVAFWNSGVDPIVVGLVMGLLTYRAGQPNRPGGGDRRVPALPRAADGRAPARRGPWCAPRSRPTTASS